MFNLTHNITGTVSRAILGILLRDGAERVWVFKYLELKLETGNLNIVEIFLT